MSDLFNFPGTDKPVTTEMIEQQIEQVFYYDLLQAARSVPDCHRLPQRNRLCEVVCCTMILKSGFPVHTQHHYGSVVGLTRQQAEQSAYKAAIDKLVPMFGFMLAQKKYEDKNKTPSEFD